MRNFHRVITAAVLSAPVALAIGGAAAAEEGPSYDQHAATAGPNGVATQQVASQQTDDAHGDQGASGGAQYRQGNNIAGPDGASSEHTSSNSGHNGGLLDVIGL